MKLSELKKLIKNESINMEFKSTTGEISQACKTLCAFLNCTGGKVFIGIKNDGRVVGQMVTDNTSQEIANAIRKIEPPVTVDVSYISVEQEKSVIALDVPTGEHVPYVFDGRPYYRVESETVLMPQHLYEQLLVKRGQLNHAWDEYIINDYSVEALDHDEIRNSVKIAVAWKRMPEIALQEEPINILKRLELLENGKPKNAAVVLYAKKIDPQFFQCMIKMARFKGTSKLDDFADNQQFYGNAYRILEEATNFMGKHLNVSSTFPEDSFVRSDKFTVPVRAAREAIINSICHRNYQNNSSISLAIFDDRMEIWNSGRLPNALKIEDLNKRHESHPRNKLLAKAMYELGLIEKWGNGTIKIFDECKANGMPEPVFEEYSSGLSVTFVFAEPIGPRATAIQKEAPELSSSALSNRQKEIIEILKQGVEFKTADIMKKLRQPPPERTLRYDLNILKKRGIIGARGRGVHAVWYKI